MLMYLCVWSWLFCTSVLVWLGLNPAADMVKPHRLLMTILALSAITRRTSTACLRCTYGLVGTKGEGFGPLFLFYFFTDICYRYEK